MIQVNSTKLPFKQDDIQYDSVAYLNCLTFLLRFANVVKVHYPCEKIIITQIYYQTKFCNQNLFENIMIDV